MQLHLEGAEDLALPRQRVYQLLTDSSFIAKSLPDAQETKVIDDSHLEARMKIGISFLTTNMNVKMALSDKIPPQHARLSVEGAGSGSNMKITSDFNLEGDNPTKMRWAADAEITERVLREEGQGDIRRDKAGDGEGWSLGSRCHM
jgi:carbon monoxide dehydrogenase subunit G